MVEMDEIQNTGMNPILFEDVELKLEVTAAGTSVAVLIKVISLESLPEGVERNDG